MRTLLLLKLWIKEIKICNHFFFLLALEGLFILARIPLIAPIILLNVRWSHVQVLFLLIMRLEHAFFGSNLLDIVIDNIDVNIVGQLRVSIDANIEIRTAKVIPQTRR